MGAAARRVWRRLHSRIVAAGTVAAVAACAVGVPLPALVLKPGGERFPCENHPCGCIDAESCWRDCCCMSSGEKLAWARANGVEPPAHLIAAAAREFLADKTSSASNGGCCSSKAKSCCSSGGSCCRETAQAPYPPRSRGKTVMLHAAMKCRGLTVSVALLPPSLPTMTVDFIPRAVEFDAAPIDDSRFSESPYLAIPTPPPRRSYA